MSVLTHTHRIDIFVFVLNVLNIWTTVTLMKSLKTNPKCA